MNENRKFYLSFMTMVCFTGVLLFTSCGNTSTSKKMNLGKYPQTQVIDKTLIQDLNRMANSGAMPTIHNDYYWSDYNYYISSRIASYMFYQDIDYDSDGTYDYRGVYFTQNRPFFDSYESSMELSTQDENGYLINQTYWFKYEPIEWDVLEEKDGKKLIITNLILDSQDYCSSKQEEKYAHNDGIGYTNNYELSSIRKWLCDTFYNTAFSASEKETIDITLVDNSVSSTEKESNAYVCNNTMDKIFLLSCFEATSYYANWEERQTKGTDYAKAQGLFVDNSSKNSMWWLRSPYYSDPTQVYQVNRGRYSTAYVDDTKCGIRPACWVTL